MAFWIFLSAVLSALFLFTCRKEHDFAVRYRKEAGLPCAVFGFGLWAERTLSKYMKPASEESRMKRALLYDETGERIRNGRQYGILWCLLFIGSILCLFLSAANGSEGELTQILRPAYGEEDSVSLIVHGLNRDETMTVTVSGQEPDRERAERIFAETCEQMQSVWLNGNVSFEEVRHDLNLKEEAENGVRLVYESCTPEVISSYGILRTEDIPEEGVRAEILVILKLGDFSKTEKLSMRIMPETDRILTEREVLEEALRQADEEQIHEEVLVLPTEIPGHRISYESEKTSPFALMFFILLLAAIYPYLMKEKLKEAYRLRNEQLVLSYPNILAKMSTLLQTGMSIRNAFLKIAFDYEEKKSGKQKDPEYAYEEMILTARMIENGMSEKEAYVAFGRRTGMRCYMKFGSLLAENVTQGISGLEYALEQEMHEALEMRKNTALKKGEEASTKLVFPMILMLGVVMIVLAVPAFMSF